MLISHASKVTLKTHQARLQQNVKKNFQMYKLDLEKAEEQEIKLPASTRSQKKQGNSRKTSTASLTMRKTLAVWITTNYGKFVERGIPGHLNCLLRNTSAGQEPTVRTGHGSMGWFKIGNKYFKQGVYCYLAYLTYMQSTSCIMPG